LTDVAPAVPSWPALLNRLVVGEHLSSDEAGDAMRDILAGVVTPVHLAAFLAVLHARGENVAEVSGFANAIADVAVLVDFDDHQRARLVDTCGTGGDRSSTINVSTTASFVVAAAGVPVCKHGNRSATSKSGAADVLEALGATIDLGPAEVKQCVERTGIGFCLAPRYHPAFRHAGPIRKELGFPTIMNFLGPLSNPGRVRRQIIGVSNPAMAEVMLAVLEQRGAERAMIVHGNDGLDELTTTGLSTIHELRDGTVRRYGFDPTTLGIVPAEPESLKGGDAAHNAERVRSILDGEEGPQTDLVALNAAGGLLVAGAVDDLATGYEQAKAILSRGSATAVLDDFIHVSKELAPQ
jgi:anthranilate phosphoribosyltransferase